PAVGAALRAALPGLSRRTGLDVHDVASLDGLGGGDRIDGTARIGLDGSFAAFRTAQARQAAAVHGAWVAAHPGALGPGVTERFVVAAQVSAEQAAAAWAYLGLARTALRAAVDGAVLVLPATSSPAPPASGLAPADKDRLRGATLRLTCLASLAGLPCVVVGGLRSGADGTGLPVGLALVGAAGSDRALLDLAGRW
nr:hypothetical protein [Micromonospora sp. DSM 115978]